MDILNCYFSYILICHFLYIVSSRLQLYVSKKYGIAGHLCPCGCGNKIITPLGRTEWHLKVKNGKPTLYPSLGNWQLTCKSHYWIIDGEIEWSYQWTEKQVKAGMNAEDIRRKAYFNNLARNRRRWSFIKKLSKLFLRE